MQLQSPSSFRQFQVNYWLWMLISLTIALNVMWLRFLGFHLVFLSPLEMTGILAACAGIALFYCYKQRDDTLCLFGNVMAQFIGASYVISTAQYIGNNLALPLIDAPLIAADKLLRFDWLAYIHLTGNNVVITSLFVVSYYTFIIVMIIQICLLFIAKESAHAQRFVIVFYVAGIVTVMLASALPAVGGYVYYDIHNPAARMHEATLLALRNHTMTSAPFPGRGLVTFPSFHAVMAVLLIYASFPLRRFRLFAIPCNVIMLFSLPAEGGHYLVDVLAGIAVALLGIWLAERILPREIKT